MNIVMVIVTNGCEMIQGMAVHDVSQIQFVTYFVYCIPQLLSQGHDLCFKAFNCASYLEK